MPFDLQSQLPPLPSQREAAARGAEDPTEASANEGVASGGERGDGAGEGEKEKGRTTEASAAEEEGSAGLRRRAAPPGESERLERQDRLREYQAGAFSGQPPLSPSASSAVAQHVLSSTARFVNAFAASVDAKLYGCSQRISRLEDQMGLLESKLSSVEFEEKGSAAKRPEAS